MALALESPDQPEYDHWYNQVQIVITTCEDMSQFSPVGQRMKACLEQMLLAAIKGSPPDSPSQGCVNGHSLINSIMGIFAEDWDLLGGDEDFSRFPPPGGSYLDDQFFTWCISHTNDISNFTPILAFTTTWLVPLDSVSPATEPARIRVSLTQVTH